MLVGPKNCAKQFLLNPLELMSKSLVNPATRMNAWMDLSECEVAYLYEFRQSSKLIPSNDFRLSLQDKMGHLQCSKNLFANNMVIDHNNTFPLFATSSGPIQFVEKYNEPETEMMDSRRRLYLDLQNKFQNNLGNYYSPALFASTCM